VKFSSITLCVSVQRLSDQIP